MARRERSRLMKFAALLLCVLVCTPASASAQDAIDFLKTGNTHRQTGELDNAIETFEQGLNMHPQSVDLHVDLAVTLSWVQRTDEALRHYNTALELDPRHRGALLGRARLLFWMGQYKESHRAYAALLSENPNDADARLGLGDLYLSEVRSRKAREIFQSLKHIRPDEADKGLERVAEVHKVYGSVAMGVGLSNDTDARPGVAVALKWRHRSRVDFWGNYAYEQTAQPGELGATNAADARLHRLELGSSLSLRERTNLSLSYGVAVDAEHRSTHALGLNVSQKFDRFVVLGGVRPQLSTEGEMGVLASAGGQWLITRGGFLMAQLFRFDSKSQHVTAVVSTLRLTPTNAFEIGASFGVSTDSKQVRFPLGAEAQVSVTSNVALFGRYDWAGSSSQHRLYAGIRWRR